MVSADPPVRHVAARSLSEAEGQRGLDKASTSLSQRASLMPLM